MNATDLEMLGLNRNEAKVYFGLLQLGQSTAANLVKHLGVHRNIIYDNLDKLTEKGLVSFIMQDAKKLFIAKDSSSIVDFLNTKKEELNKEIHVAEDLLPEIEKLRSVNAVEQEAEIFRGVQGMKKVLSEVLTCKENVVLGMTKESIELLGDTFWKNYNLKIKANKIKEKFLLNSNFKQTDIFKGKKMFKVLPKQFNQVTEVILYGGKVATFIYSKQPMVIVVTDEDYFKNYMAQFEFLWSLSK
jgi:sugar-specific transcriptional regulator TrmB